VPKEPVSCQAGKLIAEILYKARCQVDGSIYHLTAVFKLVGIEMKKFWTKTKISFIFKNYEVKSVVSFQRFSVLRS
jgi:hypothetical protein